jgi:hypothetical protein
MSPLSALVIESLFQHWTPLQGPAVSDHEVCHCHVSLLFRQEGQSGLSTFVHLLFHLSLLSEFHGTLLVPFVGQLVLLA